MSREEFKAWLNERFGEVVAVMAEDPSKAMVLFDKLVDDLHQT